MEPKPFHSQQVTLDLKGEKPQVIITRDGEEEVHVFETKQSAQDFYLKWINEELLKDFFQGKLPPR